MKENVSPTKSAVMYGVIFGAIMILEFVLMYVMKPDPVANPWVGISMQLLNYLFFPALFITLACRNFRDNHNGGFISFGQCLKIGVSITVLAAVIYSVFYVVFVLMFPEFINESLEQMKSVQLNQNPNMTDDQLEMTMSMMGKFMQPAWAVPLTILMNAFVGLIISLVVGAIVKRDNPALNN